MKTIVGLYDDVAQASAAVGDLRELGIASDQIGLVVNDADETYARELEARDTEDEATTGAVAGAAVGGVVGGLWSVLVGVGSLAIPGIGPIIAAGPIVAGLSGAALGATTGALVGALLAAGVPDEEAAYYEEGVRRGGSLLTVNVDDAYLDQATAILKAHDPVDLDRRARTWRELGWTGLDPDAEADEHGEKIV